MTVKDGIHKCALHRYRPLACRQIWDYAHVIKSVLSTERERETETHTRVSVCGAHSEWSELGQEQGRSVGLGAILGRSWIRICCRRHRRLRLVGEHPDVARIYKCRATIQTWLPGSLA